MVITNKYGLEFSIGDVCYYNQIEKGALHIITRKCKIKSFMVTDDKTYIVTHGGNNLCYVSVDDLFKDEHSAKEVVKKWQKEVLQKELLKEITSSQKSQ